MSFGEDFPSLKEWSMEDKEAFAWIRVDKMKEHCLDKQRVKEAIKKVYKTRENTCCAEWMDFPNELEKELGL